jgi:hypothetical protein
MRTQRNKAKGRIPRRHIFFVVFCMIELGGRVEEKELRRERT